MEERVLPEELDEKFVEYLNGYFKANSDASEFFDTLGGFDIEVASSDVDLGLLIAHHPEFKDALKVIFAEWADKKSEEVLADISEAQKQINEERAQKEAEQKAKEEEERAKAEAEQKAKEEAEKIPVEEIPENNSAPAPDYQCLIQPVNNMRITASFRNPQYQKELGVQHEGVDVTSTGSRTIYAQGNGTVIAAGYDGDSSPYGNVAVVRYNKCKSWYDGSVNDIIVRYYHMASVACKAGQTVTKDSVIGVMGNTGNSYGVHLHYEVDSDVKNPCYAPHMKASHNILKKGGYTTMWNAMHFTYIKATAPDHQTFVDSGYNTVNAGDRPAVYPE